MKVYVYKEHNDGNAYGEEFIQIFEDLEDAKRFLKKNVEAYFNLEWDKIPETVNFVEDESFEEDYVAIEDSLGFAFFVIEPLDVIKKGG